MHRTWAISSWSCSNGKEMCQKVYCGYKVVVLLNLNLLLSNVLPVGTIQTEERAEEWYIWCKSRF